MNHVSSHENGIKIFSYVLIVLPLCFLFFTLFSHPLCSLCSPVLYVIGVGTGGAGAVLPQVFITLYKLLTTICVVSNCAPPPLPPNQKVFPTPMYVLPVLPSSAWFTSQPRIVVWAYHVITVSLLGNFLHGIVHACSIYSITMHLMVARVLEI